MKLRTYLSLFQAGQVLLLLFPLVLSGLVAGMAAAMGRSSAEAGRFALTFEALLAPVFTAMVFALPLSCPGIALLPGAQRGLLRWHAALIAMVSIPSGILLHLAYAACPIPLGMALSTTYLSCFLITNPVRSPYGATFAAPFFLLILFLSDLRHRMFDHPAWSGGIALAITAACFFRASSRAHQRNMAGRAPIGRTARGWLQSNPRKAPKVRTLSLLRNLHAVHSRGSLWWMFAIGVGAVPLVFLILAALKPGSGGFVATIHHLITHPAEWQVSSPGFIAFVVLGTPHVAKGRRLPPFVPLSRRELPLVTLISSFFCLGGILATAIVTMLFTGIFTGQAIGQTMTVTIAAQIALSGALWLAAAPLLNPWTMGSHLNRTGATFGAAMLAHIGQSTLFNWGLLPAAIFCAVLIGFTHVAYYFELKRRFATRDLVDLSPEARMDPALGWVPAN